MVKNNEGVNNEQYVVNCTLLLLYILTQLHITAEMESLPRERILCSVNQSNTPIHVTSVL